MRDAMRYTALVAALAALGGCATGQTGGADGMTFFVTSTNPGKGGDLGGLDGADRHCQMLAGARTWRAYLSTQGSALNDPKVVHARDRIGSRPDGTAFAGAPFSDMTCGNWTNSGAEGSAMTGHHDRSGPIDHPWATSWNSSHPTRGCTTKGIESTGGDGRFYCFAVK